MGGGRVGCGAGEVAVEIHSEGAFGTYPADSFVGGWVWSVLACIDV